MPHWELGLFMKLINSVRLQARKDNLLQKEHKKGRKKWVEPSVRVGVLQMKEKPFRTKWLGGNTGRKEVGGSLARLERVMELGCGKQLES